MSNVLSFEGIYIVGGDFFFGNVEHLFNR